MALIFGIMFGQQADTLKSKNGAVILPMKGDFSFSIDAVPFLNMLNPKGESPGYYFPSYLPAIYLKFMVSNKSALMFAPIVKLKYSIKESDSDTGGIYNDTDDEEFGFRFGYEKRGGRNRLQIPYGIEGGFSWFRQWGDTDMSSQDYNNSGIKFYACLFIGTDYFFLPKISIGGRFGYGFSLTKIGGKEVGASDNATTRSYSLDYDNFGGALLMSFYF